MHRLTGQWWIEIPAFCRDPEKTMFATRGRCRLRLQIFRGIVSLCLFCATFEHDSPDRGSEGQETKQAKSERLDGLLLLKT